MSGRIPVMDRALSNRVNSAMADLETYYPDRKVFQLDQLHKGLSNRIGSLWQEVGYASREDMLSAYGFEPVKLNGASGGRPVTVDGEALLQELAQRYEGLSKPKAYGILLNENTDLKGQLKTLANKSNEVFGQSLAKELADRGLLDKGVSRTSISDDDIKAMVATLEARYAGRNEKPSTLTALKNLHPEFKDVFAVVPGRCELLYGCAPKRLFVERGILKAGKGAIPDVAAAEIENAINELGKALSSKPDEEKPKTLIDLFREFPEYEGIIKAGKKQGIIDKEPLQRLGILAPTKALLKKVGIRRASSEDLAECFLTVADDGLITPDGDMLGALPPTIVGIDAENLFELREAIIGVKGDFAKRLSVGDAVNVEICIPPRDSYEAPSLRIGANTGSGYVRSLSHSNSMFFGRKDPEGSDLGRYEEAVVVSTSSRDKLFFAQIRFRFVAELQGSTLAYALRTMGVVKSRDMRGGMGWRFRVRMAESGEFAAKRPDPSKRATRVMHPTKPKADEFVVPNVSFYDGHATVSVEEAEAEVIEDEPCRAKSQGHEVPSGGWTIGFSFSVKGPTGFPSGQYEEEKPCFPAVDRPLLGGFGVSRKE